MAVEAMKSGALDYVLKPFLLDDVERSIRSALERNREALRRTDRVRNLEETVERQSAELQSLLGSMEESSEGTLEALVAALDAREHETKAHSRRVSQYAVELAQRIGMSGEELETLRRGALLHDIGKIGVPDRILLKPATLDEQEWHQMRRHPSIGHWILNGIPWLRAASDIVLCHHERYDGSGYPRRLAGNQIPIGARVFSVADTLDAITSPRPYHIGHSFEAARDEVAAARGGQFDPAIADEFLSVPISTWSAIRSRSLAETAAGSTNLPRLVTPNAL
jgi:putative nucleotidyltransferase with HDIG domain